MEKLKPCPDPWCRSTNLSVGTTRIVCSDCGLMGPHGFYPDCVEAWNTRPGLGPRQWVWEGKDKDGLIFGTCGCYQAFLREPDEYSKEWRMAVHCIREEVWMTHFEGYFYSNSVEAAKAKAQEFINQRFAEVSECEPRPRASMEAIVDSANEEISRLRYELEDAKRVINPAIIINYRALQKRLSEIVADLPDPEKLRAIAELLVYSRYWASEQRTKAQDDLRRWADNIEKMLKGKPE